MKFLKIFVVRKKSKNGFPKIGLKVSIEISRIVIIPLAPVCRLLKGGYTIDLRLILIKKFPTSPNPSREGNSE